MAMKHALKLQNLIFFLSALVLVLISVLSYTRINEQIKASNVVSTTQLLKFKLNDAFSHLLKAESAQRGFLLTGDSSFFKAYLESQQPIPGLIMEIQSLLSNTREQNSNLKRASLLFKTRLHFLRSTLEVLPIMSKHSFDMTLLSGKNMTDELSVLIENMISNEDRLLAERTAIKEKEEKRSALFLLAFSAISITNLVYSYFWLKKESLTNAKLEEKVRERTDTIRLANQKLNEQNLDLKIKNEELSSFTFIANHDLKEPLRKIKIYSTKMIAAGEVLSLESKASLDKIIACTDRMKVLLDGIFAYTMAGHESQTRNTDLNEVLTASIQNLQELINEKQAIIQAQDLPVLKAIPKQMEQLFTNLISNSLKYSRDDQKPVIRISVDKQNSPGENPFCKISFTDNGIGFKEVYKEKIFEMFQRLHLKHEYSGTGIGLAICKKIVENHGGSITASSNNKDGAVFTFTLPLEQHLEPVQTTR